MAKVSIRIPNIAWRDGRPRFAPGPALRRIGYKGEDIRQPDGTWATLEETIAWAASRSAEIEARRTAKATTGRTPPRPKHSAPSLITVEGLFEEWWRHASMKPKVESDQKHTAKSRSAATVRDYRQKARVIAAEQPALYGAACAALTKVILFRLYERIAEKRGLATATGCIRTLSAALSFGIRRGLVPLQVNPAQQLGMETPEPRLRVAERPEIEHLVATADALGRPEIGDAILLGIWTGQRQSERLQLADEGLLNSRRIFRQQKTGAIVAIPEAPKLTQRLAAAKVRRSGAKIQRLELVIDERANQPFKPDHYRHLFAAIRDCAVHGLTDINGETVVMVKDSEARALKHYLPGLRGLRTGDHNLAASCPRKIQPLPSLAGFRDQDLRDTAVTWLALAGCTLPEIAAITGHSLQSITTVLKHYLARHPEMADHAIAKLVAWHG